MHCASKIAASLLVLSTALPAIAATGDVLPTGSGTVVSEGGSIVIEQTPADGFTVLGQWTLLKPDKVRMQSKAAKTEVEFADAGNYLFTVDPPWGMSTEIQRVQGGTGAVYLKPQIPFTLVSGEDIVIKVKYLLTKSGKVSVESSPPGLPFTLRGPDDVTYTGVSPAGFDPVPEGLYTITFDPIEGCISPKPQSNHLLPKSRIAFSLSVSCIGLEHLEQQKTQNLAAKFVTSTIDNAQIVFEDVPLGVWFTLPIATILKTGIMTGYRDDAGKVLGKFGPADNVTLAELAKIAHVLANITPDESLVPDNERAKDAWFTKYIASAEARDWLIFIDRRVDPTRPATRGEVVTTLLQAMDISLKWPTGEVFSDIRRTSPYASMIETASKAGLVEGYEEEGVFLPAFRPDATVNRAEMAKIIFTAQQIFLEDSPSFQPD